MIKLLDILALVFYGPFLWMLLLGFLLGKALKRRLEIESLPYAPYIDEVDDGVLTRHIITCLVIGAVLLILSYFLDVALPANKLMIFWFLVVAMQLVRASSMSIFLSAVISAGIFLFMDGFMAYRDLAIIAGLYQMAYGLLYLVGSPKTYPIIGQEKDGRVVGKQIYARLFLLPILGLNTQTEFLVLASLMMLVVFLYSRHELIRQTVRQFTLRHGIYHMASGALILILVYVIPLPMFVIYVLMVVLAIGWYIYDRLWMRRQPDLYVIPAKSLCVLYVRHGSVGYLMGLRPGDRIATVNGDVMIRPEAMDAFLMQYPPHIWLEVDREGRRVSLEYQDYQEGIGDLGVMFMPREIVKYQLYKKRCWLK